MERGFRFSIAGLDEIVMRDLGRTFPTNLYFMERQGQGQYALYNILRAYAAHDPEVEWELWGEDGKC